MWNSKFIILIAFVASTSAIIENDSNDDDRIQGSTVAKEGEIPYIAQIVAKLPSGGMWQCSGAILSKRFVLTTAVCGRNATKLGNAKVLTGSIERLKGRTVPIAQIIVHPEFREYQSIHIIFENNLALIRTRQDIQFDNFTREIHLPNADMHSFGGNKVRTAGWGAITVRMN